jgi:Ca-activated chloride channel homolog
MLAVWMALIWVTMPVMGAGLIIIDESQWWPGPLPPHPIPPWPPHPTPVPRPFAPLDITSVKVSTRINDQVAVTTVDQEFQNPNDSRLEGTFVFPVPKGAHLDRFNMEIDGRRVDAELLPAEKARHIYEDIVRKLRDPALLEYAGRDVFKVRIFPIEPHSKKRIRISYTELLKADQGLVSYTVPLSAEKYSAHPVESVSVKVELETKRPLKTIYSPSHEVDVHREGKTRAVAGYEASHTSPGEDFTLYFAPEKDEIGIHLLAQKQSDEDGYFVLLASPGMDVKEDQVVARDIAFVLDTSGSMAGKKLEQAKKALLFCIENLNPEDRFEIMRFSTEVEPLFEKLVPASEKNRNHAKDFVHDLKPAGGTAIDDALRQALALQTGGVSSESGDKSDRPFVIIFLTDGQPTIGATDPEEILRHLTKQNSRHSRVFCFGIGTDVNTHLLDRITEETRAFSQYVLPEEDLELKVSSFYSKIKEPVLANPTLKFTGDVKVKKLYPAPLPDLFKGEQLVLAGRYSGHGPAAVVLEGKVNGKTRKFTYEVKFPEEASDNEFIPRLWATRRVGYLLDEIRLHGESGELREEATQLARQYGIVTPYTAYLIMEDESHRNVPLAMRSMQLFDGDAAARREAAASWGDYKDKADGLSALGGARMNYALKNAQAAAPATAAGRLESSYGMLGTTAPAGSAATLAEEPKSRVLNYSQQAQFAGGKTFFQNNNQWQDSELQRNQNARRVRVQFGSPDYFALTKNSKALPWLSLGKNVQFVLNNTIYEVYE